MDIIVARLPRLGGTDHAARASRHHDATEMNPLGPGDVTRFHDTQEETRLLSQHDGMSQAVDSSMDLTSGASSRCEVLGGAKRRPLG